jgi:5'-deoxynucleotidase YfbR-like HD superfamily hydrolase
MFERELRDLAHVHRWGILRRSRQQNVAEHSYFVAIYSIEIAEWIDWVGDRLVLLRHALAHDMAELWSGDIPGPTKRAVVDAKRMEEFEYAQMHKILPLHRQHCKVNGSVGLIVSAADRLEATLFLADELGTGNRSVGEANDPSSPFGSNYARLLSAIDALPCAEDLRGALIKEIAKAIATAACGVSRIYTDPRSMAAE